MCSRDRVACKSERAAGSQPAAWEEKGKSRSDDFPSPGIGRKELEKRFSSSFLSLG